MSGGIPLDPSDELLHRQVHPNDIDGDEPSFMAFNPTSKDNRQLSTRRDSELSAEAAYRYHLDLGLQSDGSWSVTINEVASADAPVGTAPVAIYDGDEEDPGHVSILFDRLPTKGHRRAVATHLRDCAVARGCGFPTP